MPLGLEDGRVPDQVMTASSYNNIYDAPWNARLNRRRYSRFGGGWSPRRNDGHRFLQVDFQALAKVTRVATQGMQNANYWVKKYYIKYSRTRTGFATYREGRTTKVCFTYLCDVKASSPDFAQTVRGRSFQGDHLNTSYWLSKFFHRIGRFICISFFCRFSVETMIDTSPWKIGLPGFSMENTSEFTLFLGTLGLAWGSSSMDVCTVRFHLSGEVSWSLKLEMRSAEVTALLLSWISNLTAFDRKWKRHRCDHRTLNRSLTKYRTKR